MMTDKAPNLRSFQREFGDYIRKQKHDDGDTVPSRVGQLYQHLIYNNISGFINQCFPITRKIIEVHFGASLWQNLIKDFIKHGDMISPYFSEINEQFVGYLTDFIYLNLFIMNGWSCMWIICPMTVLSLFLFIKMNLLSSIIPPRFCIMNGWYKTLACHFYPIKNSRRFWWYTVNVWIMSLKPHLWQLTN